MQSNNYHPKYNLITQTEINNLKHKIIELHKKWIRSKDHRESAILLLEMAMAGHELALKY